MKIFTWLFKNVGLILGIAEIVLKAIVDIIAQIVKSLAGIVNVLQPSRAKDKLVKIAEKLEGIGELIEKIFSNVKKFFYTFGS